MPTAGTPEKWAEGKGVCLLHYLLAKEKKKTTKTLQIHFVLRWDDVV